MTQILNRSGYRYFAKHPWQVFLSILGIALGVSIVVSIDLAGSSSTKAFEMSMESVTGKATHQITGGPAGVPDSIFRFLRIEKNVRPSAPVVENYAMYETSSTRRTFRVLGIDAFSEDDFRDYIRDATSELSGGLGKFMAGENLGVISSLTAASLGLSINDSMQMSFDGKSFTVYINGILDADGLSNPTSLNDILILDIASAKIIFEMPETLTRIDLILPENESEALADLLQPGIKINPAGLRSSATTEMVRAFDLNITAMSFLALIVGMFLVYNTITFSVVQRRRLIGLYRTIGVTKKEIFTIILKESFILGIAGTILGLTGGIFLGMEMVKVVSRSINDLYFVVGVTDFEIAPSSLIKGLLLGIGASLLASLKPAREAAESPAGNVLRRSDVETGLRKKLIVITVAGVVLISLGLILFTVSERSILLSYGGILPLILGYSLLVPLIIIFVLKILTPVVKSVFGITGKIACGGIVSNLSRTGVAIAALSLAVAASVGVGTMVTSFRTTVVSWLETTLEADLYISAPSLISRSNTSVMEKELPDKIRQLGNVSSVNHYREIQILTDFGMTTILGSKYDEQKFNTFLIKETNSENLWEDITQNEKVMVTEPFAYRNNIRLGSLLKLPTDKGDREFEVAAIYYDYASDIGIINLWDDLYRKYWNDDAISGIAVFAKTGVDSEKLSDEIRLISDPSQEILIRSNKFLRESSIEVFDRTFLIAYVLQLLAVAVAFIGILSSLMALQLERAREYGVLRALGLTPSQLWKMVTLQTGLMGLIAGIISIPLGNILAAVLIYIINKRSFGWTLQFDILPMEMLYALILAVVAASLAGIYPGIKMSKTKPALALREE